MARSILVLCIVLSALVQMNLALLGSTNADGVKTQVSNSMQAAGKQVETLTTGMMPLLNGMSDALILTQATQDIETLLMTATQLVSEAKGVVTATVTDAITDVKTAVKTLTTEVQGLISDVIGLVNNLVGLVKPLLEAVGSFVNNLLGGSVTIVTSLVGTLTSLTSGIGKVTSVLVTGLQGEITKDLQGINQGLNSALDKLADALPAVAQLSDGAVSLLFKTYDLIGNIQYLVSTAVCTVVPDLVKMLKQTSDCLINIVNGLTQPLNQLLTTLIGCNNCLNGVASVAGRRRRSYIQY